MPLDHRRRWYRYHQLFADVLRARLHDERPGDVADLHRRASAWYDQHDEPADGIRHALAARDFERAADLTELAVPAMLRTRREATLRDRVKALPDEVIRVRPVLSAGLAAALLASGELDDHLRHLHPSRILFGPVRKAALVGGALYVSPSGLVRGLR